MDLIMKIAAVGIIGSVLAVTVKEYKKEFSLFIGIGTGIVIIYLLMDSMIQIKKFVWKYDYGGRHKQRVRFGYG